MMSKVSNLIKLIRMQMLIFINPFDSKKLPALRPE